MPEANDVSVIIPVYNEERGIAAALRVVQSFRPPVKEVIVVDGDSADRTCEYAKLAGARVLHSGKGRARQMNLGAAAAQGKYLCFMHADSIPPTSLVAQVHRVLADPRTVLGGFRVLITNPAGGLMRFQTAHHFAKTYYMPAIAKPVCFLRGLRCLLGDQSMFCRARDFRAVGGFNEQLVLMEDADLCIRLHLAGPCQALDEEASPAQPHSTGRGGAGAQCGGQGGARGDCTAPCGAPAAGWCLPPGLDDRESLPLLARSGAEEPAFLPPAPRDSGRFSAPQTPVGHVTGSGAGRWPKGRQPGDSPPGAPGPHRCRGRIVQVNDPAGHTSGRRMAALGNVRTTLIHFTLGLGWLLGCGPDWLRAACCWLYSNKHR